MGRAGRDPQSSALALIFATKANLAGTKSVSLDYDDEEQFYEENELDPFALPVTKENWPVIQRLLPLM